MTPAKVSNGRCALWHSDFGVCSAATSQALVHSSVTSHAVNFEQQSPQRRHEPLPALSLVAQKSGLDERLYHLLLRYLRGLRTACLQLRRTKMPKVCSTGWTATGKFDCVHAVSVQRTTY